MRGPDRAADKNQQHQSPGGQQQSPGTYSHGPRAIPGNTGGGKPDAESNGHQTGNQHIIGRKARSEAAPNGLCVLIQMQRRSSDGDTGRNAEYQQGGKSNQHPGTIPDSAQGCADVFAVAAAHGPGKQGKRNKQENQPQAAEQGRIEQGPPGTDQCASEQQPHRMALAGSLAGNNGTALFVRTPQVGRQDRQSELARQRHANHGHPGAEHQPPEQSEYCIPVHRYLCYFLPCDSDLCTMAFPPLPATM